MADNLLYGRIIGKFLALISDDLEIPSEVADGMQALLSKPEAPTAEQLTTVLSIEPPKEDVNGLD